MYFSFLFLNFGKQMAPKRKLSQQIEKFPSKSGKTFSGPPKKYGKMSKGYSATLSKAVDFLNEAVGFAGRNLAPGLTVVIFGKIVQKIILNFIGPIMGLPGLSWIRDSLGKGDIGIYTKIFIEITTSIVLATSSSMILTRIPFNSKQVTNSFGRMVKKLGLDYYNSSLVPSWLTRNVTFGFVSGIILLFASNKSSLDIMVKIYNAAESAIKPYLPTSILALLNIDQMRKLFDSGKYTDVLIKLVLYMISGGWQSIIDGNMFSFTGGLISAAQGEFFPDIGQVSTEMANDARGLTGQVFETIGDMGLPKSTNLPDIISYLTNGVRSLYGIFGSIGGGSVASWMVACSGCIMAVYSLWRKYSYGDIIPSGQSKPDPVAIDSTQSDEINQQIHATSIETGKDFDNLQKVSETFGKSAKQLREEINDSIEDLEQTKKKNIEIESQIQEQVVASQAILDEARHKLVEQETEASKLRDQYESNRVLMETLLKQVKETEDEYQKSREKLAKLKADALTIQMQVEKMEREAHDSNNKKILQDVVYIEGSSLSIANIKNMIEEIDAALERIRYGSDAAISESRAMERAKTLALVAELVGKRSQLEQSLEQDVEALSTFASDLDPKKDTIVKDGSNIFSMENEEIPNLSREIQEATRENEELKSYVELLKTTTSDSIKELVREDARLSILKEDAEKLVEKAIGDVMSAQEDVEEIANIANNQALLSSLEINRAVEKLDNITGSFGTVLEGLTDERRDLQKKFDNDANTLQELAFIQSTTGEKQTKDEDFDFFRGDIVTTSEDLQYGVDSGVETDAEGE